MNRPRRQTAPLATALGLWLGLAMLGLGTTPSAADGPEPDPVLHLEDGGQLPGRLVPSDRTGRLTWQGADFVSPFGFPLSRVSAVHWSPAQPPPRPEGRYAVELAGGDLVFGSNLALDADTATLDVPRLGRVTIRRKAIRRIESWRDGADLVYLGPLGLTGWQPLKKDEADAWREDAGRPRTETPEAAIRADLGMPAKAAIEVTLSWDKTPDFVLSLGVGDDDRDTRRAFRLEAWDDALVALRELESEADLAKVADFGDAAKGPGFANLQLYLDQEAGRLLVYSASGEPLADLTVPARTPKTLGSIQLANVRGDIRLDRLRITRWDGRPPRAPGTGKDLVSLADGSAVEGRLERFDADAGEFLLIPDEGEARRLPADVVSGIRLASNEGDAEAPKAETPRAIRAVYQDGSRLGGDLASVGDGTLRMEHPAFPEPLTLPIDGLRSILVLADHDPAEVEGRGSPVRLELEGVKLFGRPADGQSEAGRTCLAWTPDGSDEGSALKPGRSGRIVFRDPPPPPPKPAANGAVNMVRVAPARPVGALGRLAETLRKAGEANPQPAEERRAIHLRTGDIIPSEVTSITEAGVSFRSPVADDGFIPHEKIKAVEMAGVTLDVRLTKTKRERFLTLPRMQKASPPTHLIRARNGDFLRGRVLAMNDAELLVEVRLENRRIPRDRVAQVIWLHDDEREGTAEVAEPSAPEPTADPEGRVRVQAIRRDGTRLTFLADRMAEGVLSGTSDVLGACRVDLKEVDRLLIGDAIEEEASSLKFQRYRLVDAPEPDLPEPDEGGGSSGTQSVLVGKPAPEFELKRLDGEPFKLAEAKGKVVILDFWATWCGPCLQTMPQIEEVAARYADRDVILIAVNLEETADQVKGLLERQKLSPTVVLDIDGAVARKYDVSAIPQTVVIDRDGKVARLFVGGGPRFGETLSSALDAILEGKVEAGAEGGGTEE